MDVDVTTFVGKKCMKDISHFILSFRNVTMKNNFLLFHSKRKKFISVLFTRRCVRNGIEG
jgi:hypothetical protein